MSQAFQRLVRSMENHAEASASERLAHAVRVAEALLFAASAPLEESTIARVLPQGVSVEDVMVLLQADYQERGVQIRRVAGKWAFRTALDLAYLLKEEGEEPRKLSRAAMETLAIIAYHQPVTRAEIEDIRGVAANKGTLDILLEAGWVRMRGRRRSPGRPVTYGTTEAFLVQFGLDRLSDLPGLDEMKGAGLVEESASHGLIVPSPSDDPTLRDDEDALEPDLFDLMAEERRNDDEEPLNPAPETEKPVL